MNIVTARPPCYDQAQKAFGFSDDDVIYFTYGNTIYNPTGHHIADHIIRHEEVHAEQQQHDPVVAKIWWDRYIADAEFRLQQEVEAYGAQYKFICAKKKDKNTQIRTLWDLAEHLAAPLYGSCITQAEARRRISDCASGKDIQEIERYLKDDNEVVI